MHPATSPRGFDEDGPAAGAAPMTGQTLLDWGTCRTEMGILMVAGVFLVLGLGLQLYYDTLVVPPRVAPVRDPRGEMIGVEEMEIALLIQPAMRLFLNLGGVMLVVCLFIGGAPSEAGAGGWSLGTRISFLGLLIGVEAMRYLFRMGEMTPAIEKLFIFLFAGELGLVVVFWSLYQRAVAKWVGRGGVALAMLPFLILGVGCVGLYSYYTLDAQGLIGLPRPGGMDERRTLLTISTASLIGLALYQAILASLVRAGIKRFVLRNVPK
jgi:hypothetical protein